MALLLSHSQTQRHMINEVFVLEIDKNGQILALNFDCLEVFVFAKPCRLADLCLCQSITMVMASGKLVPFVSY